MDSKRVVALLPLPRAAEEEGGGLVVLVAAAVATVETTMMKKEKRTGDHGDPPAIASHTADHDSPLKMKMMRELTVLRKMEKKMPKVKGIRI